MKATVANRPADFERLGLDPNKVEPWENGLRTAAEDGTFEWWYLDCQLEDGTTMTIEFHTKPPFVSPASPLEPFIWLTLDRPDGTQLQRSAILDPTEFHASTTACDVAIGPNSFRTEDRDCVVHVQINDVEVDVRLHGEVPPWRPGAGQVLFGSDEEHHIAWLPAMSRATAEVSLSIAGETEKLAGTGYHDHNWGNIAPHKVLDHWYWGRARLGEFTVVTLLFICSRDHGHQPVPVVMMSKDDEIVVNALGPDVVTASEAQHRSNVTTGVPVAGILTYRVEVGDSTYVITFDHQRDGSFLDFGAKGAYHRLLGDVTLERRSALSTEKHTGPAMWELLYFGNRSEDLDGTGGGTLTADPNITIRSSGSSRRTHTQEDR